MVYRAQTNLIITNEETQEIVELLKRNKSFKTLLTKFLDKYAQSPEDAELWLNEGSEEKVSAEEDEKLLKVKTSLATFTAYIDSAKAMTDDNVERFSDYLMDEEYIRFKTNFEKSERLIEEGDSNYLPESEGSNEEIEGIKKEVKDIKDDMDELKSLVREAITSKGLNQSNIKTLPTNTRDDSIPREGNTDEKIVEIREKQSESIPDSGSSLDLTKSASSTAMEDEDILGDDELSILSNLGI